MYPNYPAACEPGKMPSWRVRGWSPNTPDTKMAVATLHKEASSPRGVAVHEGQYSMPFEMLIEATTCFAYPN